ncbi:hypothetical protein BJX61DRAFT_257732 [Aspergillus egyptiacus]|nr:hypothetical protein BJX61DRAFT_257732 [Aspergillus egyptiacus]
MTSPTFRMQPMNQSVIPKDSEQRQFVSCHDMTAQPRPNDIQYHQPLPFTLPYSHFAIMYINHRGELQAETSPSIAGYEKTIFTEEVQERFMKATSGEWNSAFGLPNTTTTPWYRPTPPSSAGYIPYEWKSLQHKRHRRSMQRVSSGLGHGWEPPSPSPSLKRSALRVGQTKLLRTYYEKAFDSFQQLNCRVIAKAFIKLVEPRKQVNHPYNGKRTIAGSIQTLDPEKTKPKWWPAGVTHKEPDHLGKPERIRLLAHILCELKDSHGITAEKLRDAGQDVKRQITPAIRLQVLDELYYVRGMEELYLDGKISGDTTIHVSHVNMEEEIQEYARETMTTIPTPQQDQQPGHGLHQDLLNSTEDSYHLPLRKGKRPADSDCVLPISPATSPSASRNSSMERGLPAYSSDIDPVILSGTEPGTSPAATQVPHPTGPTSLSEYFASQFATHPEGHTSHPAYWGALPSAHPQFAFASY